MDKAQFSQLVYDMVATNPGATPRIVVRRAGRRGISLDEKRVGQLLTRSRRYIPHRDGWEAVPPPQPLRKVTARTGLTAASFEGMFPHQEPD